MPELTINIFYKTFSKIKIFSIVIHYYLPKRFTCTTMVASNMTRTHNSTTTTCVQISRQMTQKLLLKLKRLNTQNIPTIFKHRHNYLPLSNMLAFSEVCQPTSHKSHYLKRDRQRYIMPSLLFLFNSKRTYIAHHI